MKKIGKAFKPPQVTFTRNITSLIIILTAVFISSDYRFVTNPLESLYVAAVSLGLYFGLVFMVRAFQSGKIGIVSAIIEAKFIPSILIYFFVFNIAITQSQILAAILILMGIVTIFITPKGFKSLKGDQAPAVLALFTSVLFGIGFALFLRFAESIGSTATALVSEIAILLYSYIHIKSIGRSITKNFKQLFSKTFVMGIASAFGTLFFYEALRIGNPSSVTLIMAAAPVMGIIIGKTIFKEKYTKKEWFGVLLVISALLIVAI
jgi:drug/metabolite transporter (DMT)-like permease